MPRDAVSSVERMAATLANRGQGAGCADHFSGRRVRLAGVASDGRKPYHIGAAVVPWGFGCRKRVLRAQLFAADGGGATIRTVEPDPSTSPCETTARYMSSRS